MITTLLEQAQLQANKQLIQEYGNSTSKEIKIVLLTQIRRLALSLINYEQTQAQTEAREEFNRLIIDLVLLLEVYNFTYLYSAKITDWLKPIVNKTYEIKLDIILQELAEVRGHVNSSSILSDKLFNVYQLISIKYSLL